MTSAGRWDHLEPATRAAYLRFDELTEQGLEPGPDVDWRVYGTYAQMRLWLGPEGGHDYDERVLRMVRSVAERDIDFTYLEAHHLMERAGYWVRQGHTRYEELFRIPLAAARRFDHRQRRELLRRLTSGPGLKDARALLAGQVTELLTEPAENGPAGVVRTEIGDTDPFARMLAEEYGARLAEVLPLFRHWNTARSTRPSARWLRNAERMLTPGAVALVRELLTRLAAYRGGDWVVRYGDNEWRDTVFLREDTIVVVRGILWSCEVIDERWVTSLVTDVAMTCGTGSNGMGSTCRCEPVTNAAVGVLARRGGLDVIVPLSRIQAKVRARSVQRNLSLALDAVAAANGLTREQLLDRTVPTFGLDADGVREERIGDYRVRLCAGVPALRYVNAAGKTVKSLPKELRAELSDLRAVLKELKLAQAAERFRLEQAIVQERTWQWREVSEYFLDHPVTGPYARALVWQIAGGPAALPVKTAGGWELAGHRPAPDAVAGLWHPIHATAGEVAAWRDHLIESGVRQPFKQVFRELYPLTPAEQRTGTFSNRFAGHVLRYGQARTLLGQRGWTGRSIGDWDYDNGGDQGEVVRDLAGWQARWALHIVSGYGDPLLCATEAITFHRDGRPASMADLPPLVLSEILREADLAVGVASVARDEQALVGHERYWHSHGFGELTGTAKIRREALARLLPRLKIASRLELTDRFLVVRGDLKTYKIHLGSANVLMEPNDAYLCIVPAGGGGAAGSVFLPFEDDGGTLSVILSKAFLLADDTAITDPTITRQLG
ncbi:DUF4132 domain-containing protein [Nonomuraea sp. FMUSA5-5]|uniref:DUF4132 domain-containing protein n=1 Tax=Nonomuraea composti TaxID=2720023 RepID=A0ABX1B4L6_9ACTN|nr:DUF4132 domain-containing protein [Nonomuraea sp. FMUSA5-5]NJP91757.1 DUF4132 domain-containing protein [Nonomuraea sp. FMUSA5-5]